MAKENKNKVAKKTGRRLSKAQWAEATRLYEMGVMNQTQLEEKFGINRENFYRRFKRDGVEYGSKTAAVGEAVTESVKEELETLQKDYLKRLVQSSEEDYQISHYISLVSKKLIRDALDPRSGTGLASIAEDVKVLRGLSAVVKDVTANKRDICNSILRMTQEKDEDQTPVLEVSELSAEEIKEMREAQELDDNMGLESHEEKHDS